MSAYTSFGVVDHLKFGWKPHTPAVPYRGVDGGCYRRPFQSRCSLCRDMSSTPVTVLLLSES